jgi:2-C-methyl-D-erythritol 2,4-cyclodiphosphate synthase
VQDIRIGQGIDVHRLVPGRRLMLGGVEIPFDKGLLGHSDADVVLHAITDAILGALGLGDIGRHFPDTDKQFKDVSSLCLLDRACGMMRERGYRVLNIDATIVAEQPRLSEHIPAMEQKIRDCVQPIGGINVKATTAEGMGFTGRLEGIAALAVTSLVKP